MKLLIVDDHAQMRALLRELTAALASEIRECASAEQALSTSDEYQPDCIIMDLRLPGMNGVEAIERMRTLQPNVRIIAVTRFDDPDVRTRTLAAGADYFFPKHRLVALRDCLLASGTAYEGGLR